MTDHAALEAKKRELLAEVERIDAQLKADPLLVEAIEMAAQAFELDGDHVTAREVRAGIYNDEADDLTSRIGFALAALRRGMGLTSRAAMGEREIEELARDCLSKWGMGEGDGVGPIAMMRFTARETLRRVPGWPEEEDGAQIIHEAMAWAAQGGEKPKPWQGGNSFAEDKARETFRRLKARMGAGGEA